MPAEFPLPSVSGSNPQPESFEKLQEDFVVGRTIYDDNGADYKLQAGGTGKKTWAIRYSGLTFSQFSLLTAWVATMFYSEDEGSAYGANFRDHVPGTAYTDTSGTLYSSVHIAPGGFKYSHSKSWAWAVEVILEKRP